MHAIGNRLLDWFSVIMSINKKGKGGKRGSVFPTTACKYEVRWMFKHLDSNSNGYLSSQELYELEHDQNEKCMSPFIKACNSNRDAVIDINEWCRCFEKTQRPCLAAQDHLKGDIPNEFLPSCDSEGFYLPTQCHNAVGICWCVDKHGVEFANTRTQNKPNCDEIINNTTPVVSDDEDDDVNDNDQSEGSADKILMF